MKTKAKKEPAPAKLYEFQNNKGETIHLSGNLTLKDLAALGVRNVSLSKRGEPIKDGQYVHDPK